MFFTDGGINRSEWLRLFTTAPSTVKSIIQQCFSASMYGKASNPFKMTRFGADLRYAVSFAVIVMGSRFYLANQCVFKLRAMQLSKSLAIAERLKALRWKMLNFTAINEVEDLARANLIKLQNFTATDISNNFEHHEFTLRMIDEAANKMGQNWRNTTVLFDNEWILDLFKRMNRQLRETPPHFNQINPSFQSRIQQGGRGANFGRGRGRGGRGGMDYF